MLMRVLGWLAAVVMLGGVARAGPIERTNGDFAWALSRKFVGARWASDRMIRPTRRRWR